MGPNKLTLRTLQSPFPLFPDTTLGSVLSHEELDNNFLYIKGQVIYSAEIDNDANLIFNKIDGSNFTLPLSAVTISAVTENTYVTGGTYNGVNTITFRNNSGGTFNVTGIVDTNIYPTGLSYNVTGDTLTLTNNNGSTLSTSGFVSSLIDKDENTYVTGGTYNGVNTITFRNNSGGTFNVTGITILDTYVTGSTYNSTASTLTFRNNQGGSFNVAVVDKNEYTTGGTYNGVNTITFTSNSGNTFNVTGITTSDTYVTGGTYNSGTTTLTLRNNSGNTISMTGFSKNPTGFEAINEGNGIGWRLIGKNPANYGNVGLNAIDGSNSTSTSSTRGAIGEGSVAFGTNNTAAGNTSFVHGQENISNGDGGFVVGAANNSSGQYSFAGGVGNIISGDFSTVFGASNNVSGQYSFVGGTGNNVSGDTSFVVGTTNNVSGNYSASFGQLNVISGDYSAGFGLANNVNGLYSSAFGGGNIVSGNYSFAIGSSNTVTGNTSFVGGTQNLITNRDSFVYGLGGVSRYRNQTVVGKWNIDNGYVNPSSGATSVDKLFTVGNGTSSSGRSDAFNVFNNGAVLFTPISSTTVTNGMKGMYIYDLVGDEPKYHDGSQWQPFVGDDIYLTGGTFSPTGGTITFRNNQGGSFNVSGITVDSLLSDGYDTFVGSGGETGMTTTYITSLTRHHQLFRNGQLELEGVNNEYTISGNKISFNTPLTTGEIIQYYYKYLTT